MNMFKSRPVDEIVPWRAAALNGQECILHFSLIGNSYQLMFSDLQTLYVETVDEDHLESKCKILNPALQAPSSRILQEIKSIIDNFIDAKNHSSRNSILSVTEKTEDFLKIKAETKLVEIPFTWCFSLSASDSAKIFASITKPLISMTAELQRRQRQLIGIIKKKDIEIDDYKMGGAKVSRTYLETLPFSENNFFTEMNKFEDIVETVKNSLNHVFGIEEKSLYSLIVAASNSISEEQNKSQNEISEMSTENNSTVLEAVKNKEASSQKLEMERRRQLEKQLAEAEERKKAKRKKKLNL